MDALAAVLRRFTHRSAARWWLGERPDSHDGRLVAAIAAHVGLPTTAAPPLRDRLVRLNRQEAAHVLAVAGTTSLAHGDYKPRRSAIDDVRFALTALGDDAVLLGNGHWQAGNAASWNPLTDATFDCGVLGYDRRTAFIFWVEEED